MHTHAHAHGQGILVGRSARKGPKLKRLAAPTDLPCSSLPACKANLSPSYYASRSLARVLILRSAARISGSAFILGVILARMSCAALA